MGEKEPFWLTPEVRLMAELESAIFRWAKAEGYEQGGELSQEDRETVGRSVAWLYSAYGPADE